jgi:predicted alpha/beta-fold hydrolase
MPKYGGHVGFIDSKNVYYNEKRALKFVNEKELFCQEKSESTKTDIII